MHTVVGLLLNTEDWVLTPDCKDIVKFNTLSKENQDKVAENIRHLMLNMLDDKYYNKEFDWRENGPGRWRSEYMFKREGLIIGHEDPTNLIAMANQFSKRPINAATTEYLRDKHYTLHVESIERLNELVDEFNSTNSDIDIKVHHVLDKAIEDYSKYDILYTESFPSNIVFMNLFPETISLLIKLKKWDDGIPKEKMIHELETLIRYATSSDANVRDLLSSIYKRYHKEKERGLSSENFRAWRQTHIMKLLSGEFTFDSGFYYVNDDYTLLNKYELSDIEKNPKKYVMLIIDIHY